MIFDIWWKAGLICVLIYFGLPLVQVGQGVRGAGEGPLLQGRPPGPPRRLPARQHTSQLLLGPPTSLLARL